MKADVIFDKTTEPNDELVQQLVGETYSLWNEIRTKLHAEYGDLHEEWKYYGKKSGWTLKKYLKKRNLFFFKPYDGYFMIAFVFGDKAVQAVEESDLPVSLKTELREARKYAEGRGLRLDIQSPEQVDYIIKLVDIKVKH